MLMDLLFALMLGGVVSITAKWCEPDTVSGVLATLVTLTLGAGAMGCAVSLIDALLTLIGTTTSAVVCG